MMKTNNGENKRKGAALCKVYGMLAIVEIKELPRGSKGKCFDCGGTDFHTSNGWIECLECGFAVLEKNVKDFLSGEDTLRA